MKTILVLILSSLLASFNSINSNPSDSFIGSWSMVTTTTEASNMEICHRFIFNFTDENKGNLSIELSVPNDPTNVDLFLARIPFKYQIIEEESDEFTQKIDVQYSTAKFNHIRNKREKGNIVPLAYKNYIEEIERSLTDQANNYSLNLDGENYLVIKGFSLLKNTSFASFRKGGAVESCNDLK